MTDAPPPMTDAPPTDEDVARIARGAALTPLGWFVWQPCHQWAGPRMGENRGYVCRECGAQVESASEMPGAPRCRERPAPISWLPGKIGRRVAAHLAQGEGER